MTDLLVAVTSVLATSAARWTALARHRARSPGAQAGPGEWSAIQCLQHVVDTEQAVFRAGDRRSSTAGTSRGSTRRRTAT